MPSSNSNPTNPLRRLVGYSLLAIFLSIGFYAFYRVATQYVLVLHSTCDKIIYFVTVPLAIVFISFVTVSLVIWALFGPKYDETWTLTYQRKLAARQAARLDARDMAEVDALLEPKRPRICPNALKALYARVDYLEMWRERLEFDGVLEDHTVRTWVRQKRRGHKVHKLRAPALYQWTEPYLPVDADDEE